MTINPRARTRAEARIVCLVPVRNGGDELRGWLDETARFADVVVALDDGSTDDTNSILTEHPIVAKLLVNDRRDGYLGWHDGRNRNRLLRAAAEFAPCWIMWLDADERLDEADARQLRLFVEDEAIAGCAYGFQVYRMHERETYDPDYGWIYRLFMFRDGQSIVNRRFDFVPVPSAIGPDRWVKTTIRVKHYGDAGAAGREERVAKYHEADPEGAFREYYEHLGGATSGPFPQWQPRNQLLPVLHDMQAAAIDRPTQPFVLALLPARNCAGLLPGWFESISRVADAVVALDDGSTDDTARLLREHPLVVEVLSNPPQEGFADWDDGKNRNRLLSAASAFVPEWIVSVDADERIPLDDAAALRRFLRFQAKPGYAYALASYRMIGDESHYDRLDYDAYRLFAFEPGQVFPDDKLHAPPIPTSVTQWRQTTIRMQHLASLTEQHRIARREKFRQADPECVWEPDYDYTVEQPGERKTWERRPLSLPVLVHPEPASQRLDELDLSGPILTIVIAVAAGEEREANRMLEGLAPEFDSQIELVVVTRDEYAAEVVKRAFPAAVLVDVDAAWTDGRIRNAAMMTARGDYVAFLDVHDRVLDGGLTDLIAAHEGGHGIVQVQTVHRPNSTAGAVLRGSDLDWAAISFIREPLIAAGGFGDHAQAWLDDAAASVLQGAGFTTASVSSLLREITSTELVRRHFAGVTRSAGGGPWREVTALWRLLRSLDPVQLRSVGRPRAAIARRLAEIRRRQTSAIRPNA